MNFKEPYLASKVPGLMKDRIGNYHKIIGNSETLFVCHLDNFCKTKLCQKKQDENIYVCTNNSGDTHYTRQDCIYVAWHLFKFQESIFKKLGFMGV